MVDEIRRQHQMFFASREFRSSHQTRKLVRKIGKNCKKFAKIRKNFKKLAKIALF